MNNDYLARTKDKGMLDNIPTVDLVKELIKREHVVTAGINGMLFIGMGGQEYFDLLPEGGTGNEQ